MLAFMTLACASLGTLMYSQHLAHASDPDKSIPAIEVQSAAPGEISVTWSEPPHRYGLKDYRLTYGVMNNGEAFTQRPSDARS